MPKLKNDSPSPSPDEIIALAQSAGYRQRRPMVSSTLFFEESNPAPSGMQQQPCLINIFYTTRSIMTYLHHPSSSSARGTNQLWRSNAYADLNELRALFENPRLHTNKGFRDADKAVRGCVRCGMMKPRTEFSRNQWLKGPDENKCKECTNNNAKRMGDGALVSGWDASKLTSGVENSIIRDSTVADDALINAGMGNLTLQDDATNDLVISAMENLTLLDDTDFPSLTADALKKHNKKANNKSITDSKDPRNKLVRRQFNCPDCPKHGRSSIFFKKVPAAKPLCKCPSCKRATNGNCRRLYPVPQAKGYGMFKCTVCLDTWGSSRAVANIGQECFTCVKKGRSIMLVTPFRIEKLKKKKRGGMRRVPTEPIQEDEVDEREYGESDQMRNQVGGVVGGTDNFQLEPRGDGDFEFESSESIKSKNDSVGSVTPTSRIPSGYRHKCGGCASGVCMSKRVPFSARHDHSDGNTVSTRASVVTDSSIDKTDFYDRDEDFSGFEEQESSEGSWIES